MFVLGVNTTADGYGIWHSNGSGWTPFPGSGVALAVDSSGRPWIVNSSGGIWHWDGANWQPEPGSGHYVAAGEDGSVYVLGTNSDADGYGLWRWTGSGWAPFDGYLADLAVGRDGSLWGVNASDAVCRHPGGAGWGQMPGSASDVATLEVNAAWVVGTNAIGGGYGPWAWQGSGWAPLQGGVVEVALYTVNSVLWGINDTQAITATGSRSSGRNRDCHPPGRLMLFRAAGRCRSCC